MKIGVLALQGAIKLHQAHLEALGAKYIEVTGEKHLKEIDGLILPGGESSVMLKLVDIVGLGTELKAFAKSKPVWGICAGAILMARSVSCPIQPSYNVIDISIQRNAYGRQLESTEQIIDGYYVSFIRAPRILMVGKNVSVMKNLNNDPIWVESGNLMVTTFHPEINNATPSPWHIHFAKKCKGGS
ncbi:MAG: hypothetical protein A2X86_15675 [Bdellovibrionales bacterium GWA2_49_15]|nr:MAG: hypothetical protein A2X86_15675 [Bdellovibrionales bacterium GWA2_49_15]HAZ14570.1 pyridoxal 5'-phosphate synthase glutaminase subunit PdxT [Bdellovibrionales bacterium]